MPDVCACFLVSFRTAIKYHAYFMIFFGKLSAWLNNSVKSREFLHVFILFFKFSEK